MYFKVAIVHIALLLCFSGNAQDCTLDVGGKNTDVLVGVFQMRADQVAKMETLSAALQLETKGIEDEIQKLFDTHPQSTQEELTKLSFKYKVLQDKIVNASKAADKKLLSTFNVKQYQRYLDLCHEAVRNPIRIVPIAVKDTITDPK